MADSDLLKIGLAQMTPVWLNREKTLQKMKEWAKDAGQQACKLLVFPEAFVPGYPFWLELTDGARFNNKRQKELHAHYLDQAIQLEQGHLDGLCQMAKEYQMMIVLGSIERPSDRGGHSVYCSMITINTDGQVLNVHRKLMPTYEERLCWSPGDGHGLRTFPLGAFTVGGLNCWENWMPLPRAALYGMGEDLHLAIWPGQLRNTEDITPFLAKEGRSYSISVCSFMRREDIPLDLPYAELIRENSPEILANGGSCIAAPNGEWLVEPVVNEEKLIIANLDHARVREERQNFDPVGHYSRPDVTQLVIDRTRQSTLKIKD